MQRQRVRRAEAARRNLSSGGGEGDKQDGGVLPSGPVDMRRRRPVLDGPRLLQPVLQGDVPREKVHRTV